MAGDRILEEGEEVQPGDGTIRCPRRRESGVPCRGALGLPPVGAILLSVEVLPRGERLRECEVGFDARFCLRCGAVLIFGLPRAA